MSNDKDDLTSIKVYKFDNTKESWHEFALKFRVIGDSRGCEDIIDGTKSPPDKMESLKLLSGDEVEKQKVKKEKLAARMANKKGHRDLVMSTKGISLNIIENATSDKLSKGDLKSLGKTREEVEPQN